MSFIKKVFIYFIIINLFFPAPLRFLFFVLNANYLNYSFNIVLALAIVVFKRAETLNAIQKYSWVFAYLVVIALYSAIFESSTMIFFFFYTVIPICFYMLYQEEILDFINTSKGFLVIILILSAAGVLYDYYYDFPWKLLTYNLDKKDVDIAKNWSSDGIERVAGFYRSSYDAAIGMLFLAILVIYNSERKIYQHLFFALTFLCVYITTTKGCLVSVVLVYVVYLLKLFSKDFARTMIIVMMLFLSILIVSLPFGILQNVQIPFLNNASFFDRINNEWPFIMDQFKSFADYVLGVGVGAIGVAQKIYGNINKSSAGDNFFIYMYGNFGIAAFFIFLLVFRRIMKVENQLFLYMTIFLFSYGITTNIVESPIGQLIIDISLFMLFNVSAGQKEEIDFSSNDYYHDLRKL